MFRIILDNTVYQFEYFCWTGDGGKHISNIYTRKIIFRSYIMQVL